MKLREFEGKELFKKYSIVVPVNSVVITSADQIESIVNFPVVVKAQVYFGDRKKAGGILFAKDKTELKNAVEKLLGKKIYQHEGDEATTEVVTHLLVEPQCAIEKEFYVSFSYDSSTKKAVLLLSPKGGSGIAKAFKYSVSMLKGLHPFEIRKALKEAKFDSSDIVPVSKIIQSLFKLFCDENLIVAEINPLCKLADGSYVALDSKIDFGKRKSVDYMGGDIAIIASGGGASLVNIDALLKAGGKPANYAEYSGNPPREVVTKITTEVLARPGIKACWVVGGTANFTDIYETMSGFVEALKQLPQKPNFPFVIRRGGPRQAEAKKMLEEFSRESGIEFHMYGSETSMTSTAKKVVELAYKNNSVKK